MEHTLTEQVETSNETTAWLDEMVFDYETMRWTENTHEEMKAA
jgi:hypothetical protein